MSAGWVAEGAQKPVSEASITLKTITPHKLAAIAVVSAEVVRANPGNYMDLLRPQIAEAFAVAFDNAALHDLGPDGTGTGPFTTFVDQTSKESELGNYPQNQGGTYQDLVQALSMLVNDTNTMGRHYHLTGWAIDDVVEPMLLSAVDTTGHPLWADLPVDQFSQGMARPGRLLMRPSFMGEGVQDPGGSVVGYGGDWQETRWGVVGGINYDVSTEATVTLGGTYVSLWENNLMAIRAEAEYGWLVNDTEAFVRLTNETS
jgi:HK97 family phage major capsid protein